MAATNEEDRQPISFKPGFLWDSLSYTPDEFKELISKYSENTNEYEKIFFDEYAMVHKKVYEKCIEIDNEYKEEKKKVKQETKNKKAEIKNSTLIKIYKGIVDLTERIIPAGAAYYGTKIAIETNMISDEYKELPIFALLTVGGIAHFGFKKWGKSYIDKKMQEIENEYDAKIEKLDDMKDEKKTMLIKLAEEKLRNEYEDLFHRQLPSELESERVYRIKKLNKPKSRKIVYKKK